MNKIKTLILTASVLVLPLLFAASVTTLPSLAATCTGKDCVTAGVGSVGDTGAGTDLQAIIKKIVNVLLFVIGAVSVIMIVVGAIKYVTANGDTSALTSAKNTILYAVIGLLVALMAYAIVNFVVVQFVQ